MDALATFAEAMGTPKPAACADRPLSKQEATAAAAALTLTDADSRALLAEVIAFDKKRFALHGQKLRLSDTAVFFYDEGSGDQFVFPGEVTESPSRSHGVPPSSCVLSAPPLSRVCGPHRASAVQLLDRKEPIHIGVEVTGLFYPVFEREPWMDPSGCVRACVRPL